MAKVRRKPKGNRTRNRPIRDKKKDLGYLPSDQNMGLVAQSDQQGCPMPELVVSDADGQTIDYTKFKDDKGHFKKGWPGGPGRPKAGRADVSLSDKGAGPIDLLTLFTRAIDEYGPEKFARALMKQSPGAFAQWMQSMMKLQSESAGIKPGQDVNISWASMPSPDRNGASPAGPEAMGDTTASDTDDDSLAVKGSVDLSDVADVAQPAVEPSDSSPRLSKTEKEKIRRDAKAATAFTNEPLGNALRRLTAKHLAARSDSSNLLAEAEALLATIPDDDDGPGGIAPALYAGGDEEDGWTEIDSMDELRDRLGGEGGRGPWDI